jgi:sulfatase maturation enzyme AslB (radical SAM superfamily)
MYSFNEIKRVHLELSSLCNARCPGCPRNFYGYPFNDGYIERNLSLRDIQQIFTDSFLQQLIHIRINGNFGDFVSNNESLDIVKWLLSKNRNLEIRVSTNGSAQNKKFWQELGKTGIIVEFCIDGLHDTHSIYRQGTNFNKILKNATIFANNGGVAHCRMIEFDHNKDQKILLEKIAYEHGFTRFKVIKNTRGALPAFDNKGNLISVINNLDNIQFKETINKRKTDEVLLKDIVDDRTPSTISCEVKDTKEIYIASTGDVYPCCYMGFEPKTYGHGNYHAPVNAQFKDFIERNNAIEYPIEECIAWFYKVKESWDIGTFEDGRLIVCNDNCSVCSE